MKANCRSELSSADCMSTSPGTPEALITCLQASYLPTLSNLPSVPRRGPGDLCRRHRPPQRHRPHRHRTKAAVAPPPPPPAAASAESRVSAATSGRSAPPPPKAAKAKKEKIKTAAPKPAVLDAAAAGSRSAASAAAAGPRSHIGKGRHRAIAEASRRVRRLQPGSGRGLPDGQTGGGRLIACLAITAGHALVGCIAGRRSPARCINLR